ncbi:CPBP family intramembrane metalloprotease [Treponema ruminis]|uniref:Membrane protease YdiL (CAAX protease family) n=1 Tax=Treponema ruminis TaxID=744515 RepID=A0A7W8LML5_9SPIR|nr:CPBP family intramembrane glutamic endopeptidase [Treponema ruminis]MBB5226607.1 membrane protease YdiL (CAAX protease family) [Treponema ruminis]QSI02164.1 CPBP family intramembrane metalloprotease [Treponema ruminis]
MEKKIMLKFVVASYLVFWAMVMGICGSASMVFHCPPLVMRILSNVCAWAPTIVLLVGFRYFVPGKSIREFYRNAFAGKVTFPSILTAALLTLGATLVTVALLSAVQGRPFASYWNLGSYPFWASFLFSVTTGPTGEESGWRGYVRPYLNSRHGFFAASVIQGLIWAFWHTILWFVDSDFMGLQMIHYVLSNVIVMTGLCFIMNFFMEKHDNLLYGIVIHFCFNFLYCFLEVDIFFYIILSAVYLAVIAGICLARRRRS